MKLICDTTVHTVDILTLTTEEYAIIRTALSVGGVVAHSPRNREAFQKLYAELDEAANEAVIY